jgi:methionine-rich copper-binding protein CopC
VSHRSPLPLVAGTLLALVLVVPALAHAELVSSDPADGEVLDGSPRAITLIFNDRLVSGRSFFELVGPGGNTGSRLRGEVDAARPRRLVLVIAGPLAPTLAPGAWEVRWRAIADDGHDELKRGIVRFTVLAPTPSPATPLPPTATPGGTNEPATIEPPTASPSTAMPTAAATPVPTAVPGEPAAATADVLLPIVVGLLLVGGVGVRVLRRSRRA